MAFVATSTQRTLSDLMLKPRSALIVAFPIPRAIEAIRRDHVPVARLGVPPHVTILSPFMAAEDLDATVRRRLAHIAARCRAFDVELAAVRRFQDALYLAPAPAEPFRRLTTEVVAEFPGYPPYGEPSYRPEDGVPHLTISMGGADAFDSLATSASRYLPLVRRARILTVVGEDPDGRWRVRWRIPLGPAGSA